MYSSFVSVRKLLPFTYLRPDHNIQSFQYGYSISCIIFIKNVKTQLYHISIQMKLNIYTITFKLVIFTMSKKSLEIKYLLDHIHNFFASVEPQIMIGNGHPLKCDSFGILEERIRSPNFLCH